MTKLLESQHVQEWCDEQKKYREMPPEEYQRQLTELIDYAGMELSEADSEKVLLNAFNLIRMRLGITIQSKFVMSTTVEKP